MAAHEEPLQDWKPGGLGATLVGLLGWAAVVAIVTLLFQIEHHLQAVEQLLRARPL